MIEILHVSDLHFGKSAKQNRKAKSLLEGISRQFPFPGYDDRYLLVTGDITDSGNRDEYERVREALSPFKGHIFVTPGNHDYGSLKGTLYIEERARYFDNPFATALGFTHPFFDKKVFVQELQDSSGHNALMIIGLNSCAKEGLSDFARGEVGATQRKELDELLTHGDTQIPKLVFLHHIPNRDAEYELVMTLEDWEELMAIVRGRVDVLAFGHQGNDLAVDRGKRSRSAQIRRMALRSLVINSKGGSKGDGKGALVLDADNSVAEQAFYVITLDGNKPTARVESVAGKRDQTQS